MVNKMENGKVNSYLAKRLERVQEELKCLRNEELEGTPVFHYGLVKITRDSKTGKGACQQVS